MLRFGQLFASVPPRLASAGIMIALPILAVTEMNDVALGAALVAIALAPSVIAAPFVGIILDRAKAPRAVFVTVALITGACFAIASGLGDIPTPIVMIALALSGALNSVGFGGLSSFLSPINGSMRRSYALDALSYNISSVVGPALVALIGATLGARTAMVLLAVIAALGALGIFAMPIAPRKSERASVVRTILAGARALVRIRPLAVVTLSGTLNELGKGALPIIAVAIALRNDLSADAGGWQVTALALGALLGTFIESVRPQRMSAALTMGISTGLTGVFLIIAGLDVGYAWTIGCTALAGVFTAASTASMLYLRRAHTPPQVAAQIFTVASAFRVGAGSASAGIAGLLVGVDPLWLLAGCGAIWIIAALVLFAYPRGLDVRTGQMPVHGAVR
ncbi:MFS transporter [Humidisolicoccus flavus]|uniref:MFS transporter n=1 Tax=Humidisolicoccus flavus TaxID=3111414 RepID=UPI00325052EB